MKLHLSCGLCRLCGNCRTCRTSIIAGKDKKGRKKKNSAGSTSTSSCLSTHEMSNIIEELKLHQHRDSTKRNYLAIWRVFNQFFVRLDYKPHEWTERLNLFVGYLIQSNKKSAMVKSYISAIKAVLSMNNIKIVEDRYLLCSLVKACRLKNDVVKTRLPIQKAMLGVILKEVSKQYAAQPYLASLYRAMISIMYFGLLRISEVGESPHHL